MDHPLVERSSRLRRPRLRQSVDRGWVAHSGHECDAACGNQEGHARGMTISAPEHQCLNQAIGDPSHLLEKEWLVTNGVGGYASGSVLGVATRRYHGVFVPDLPGRGRTMMVPRLDEIADRGTYRDRKSTRLNSSHLG